MNKQKYLQELRDGVVTVSFKKVSGVNRTMRCTLSPQFLPERAGEATDRVRNDDVCNVWSTDDAGWRSFRWDSITEWLPESAPAPIEPPRAPVHDTPKASKKSKES